MAKIAPESRFPWQRKDFSVLASDAKGHSERVFLRLPPSMLEEMDSIVRKGRLYDSLSGLIRHCVFEMLPYLHKELEYPVPTVLSELRAITDIVNEQSNKASFTEMLQSLGALIADQDDERASYLVNRVLDHVRNMPKGYWRDKYEREITSRYKRFVKERPAGSLKPSDQVDVEV